MKYGILIFSIVFSVFAETLFEVKDASNNKVLDVSTDGLTVLNNGDTIMVIALQGIKAFIQPDAKDKALSRTFAVTTSSSKGDSKGAGKVFEIATDAGATFYNPSDNSDEILNISKGSITANVNQSLGREFLVNDDVISKANSNLMKISSKTTADAVSDSTMLWYKEKNAFRVGYVYITTGGANVGQASFASGYRSQASGKYSSAIGYRSLASNNNAFASGNECTASGQNSTAIGSNTKALGSNSFAAGSGAEASTANSMAIGFTSKASGDNAIAIGSLLTSASGNYSTAVGVGAQSTGLYSTAMGRTVTAQSQSSHVVGCFNLIEGSTTEWISSDPLFVIGNGTSLTDRSNALEVTKEGDVGINVAPNSSYRLFVQDNYQAIRGIAVGDGTSAYGVFGRANAASSTNYGIYGNAYGGTTNWAGYFSGDVRVTGTLDNAKSETKTDHPLDPENKYLSHSGVISDQMTTVYNGNVILDIDGKAKVKLPDWFESFNSDFKYQLTAIGVPGPNLYISRKVSGNSFDISGGTAEMEVSWMITAVRKDNFAKSNPIKIEEEKQSEDKGYYLHPEAFGLSAERGIDFKNEIEDRKESLK
jgi:hypothetical protein